jgi:tRNA threonylcarbamoyladenosine biosynthesis protein TsaE
VQIFETHSEAETERVGAEFASKLPGGTVVAFYGELGSGKTAFVRGMARGMGLSCRVSSPTFTIVNEYEGDRALFHFDMYRLSDSDELFDLGWEDYLARNGVCAVEWSENVADALENPITVTIERDPCDDNRRRITITGGRFDEAVGL